MKQMSAPAGDLASATSGSVVSFMIVPLNHVHCEYQAGCLSTAALSPIAAICSNIPDLNTQMTALSPNCKFFALKLMATFKCRGGGISE